MKLSKVIAIKIPGASVVAPAVRLGSTIIPASAAVSLHPGTMGKR